MSGERNCIASLAFCLFVCVSSEGLGRKRTDHCGKPWSLHPATLSHEPCQQSDGGPDHGLLLLAAWGSSGCATTSFRVRVRCKCVLESCFFLGHHSCRDMQRCAEQQALLLFADTLAHAPETVGADGADHEQVGRGTETAGGQVALVLDGLVAAGGRHVLRHDGRVVCVYVSSGEVSESRWKRGGMGNWLSAV